MRRLSKIPRLQEWINLLIGAALFGSPWLLQYRDLSEAAWNAHLCGLIICAVAVMALLAYEEWEEWHGVVLGVWIMAAPWVLEFDPVVAAAGVHVLLGALLIASEAREIWVVRHTSRA
jgi:uncharacterized membrane protein HdeD (DUF308 family)